MAGSIKEIMVDLYLESSSLYSDNQIEYELIDERLHWISTKYVATNLSLSIDPGAPPDADPVIANKYSGCFWVSLDLWTMIQRSIQGKWFMEIRLARHLKQNDWWLDRTAALKVSTSFLSCAVFSIIGTKSSSWRSCPLIPLTISMSDICHIFERSN